MKPERFHRLATVVLGLNALIVLTGAGVRLTGSGLGCDDWPNCEEGRLAPVELDLLGWIEFGNRLLSGVVGLACVAVLAAAFGRRPKRRDLVSLAAALVVGSAAQIALGAFIIILDLDPIAVGGHFLISAAMLVAAVALWVKAMPQVVDGRAKPWWHRFDLRAVNVTTPDHQIGEQIGEQVGEAVSPGPAAGLRTHGRVLMAAAAVVVVAGVIVTGTGPNSGDSRATRLPFEFDTVARAHGVTVWVFVAVLVAMAVRVRPRVGDSEAVNRLQRLVRWLLMIAVAQGAVGYGQYVSGVPPVLVELHILGAVTLWMLVVVVWMGCERTASRSDASGSGGTEFVQPPSGPNLRDVLGGVVEHVEPVQ